MNSKIFKLAKEDILPIATGYGSCIATDKIVVDGERVGYMYREDPINKDDSGWRFLAGSEDSAYMTDNSRHGVYNVNTIANYDKSIIPFLKEGVGARIERGMNGLLSLIIDK